MTICGNIISCNNFKEFSLSCIHCNKRVKIQKWEEIVNHLLNDHKQKSPDIAVLDESDVTQSSKQLDPLLESTDFEAIPIARCKDNFNPTFYRHSPRTTKFIELYKTEPCLWNPSHSSFKNEVACATAYVNLINQLKILINVNFSTYKLKKAINSLHSQYDAIKAEKARDRKIAPIPLSYYEKFSFLGKRSCMSLNDTYKNHQKIKLIFTEINQLTTSFIELYEKFPQLYDSNHNDFFKVNARRSAYKTMTVDFKAANSHPINQNDVYDSVVSLRHWYCRRMKCLTDLQPEDDDDGLQQIEKHYLNKCRKFLASSAFRLKLPCEICEKHFSSDHALQAHLYRSHKLGELPFKCDQCESSFERRCHLQQHNQRVHIGKQFNCSTCDRSFAFLSHLNLHQRSHEEMHIEKPFVCEFCGKSFKQKIQMSNHVTAIHTKIRAFKCEMCPKDFLRKRDLKDHIKAHLNIRDKICEICKKSFTNANALVKHRHIHKEKTLQCTLCSTRFAERVSLGVHMKRTHKIVRSHLKLTDIPKVI